MHTVICIDNTISSTTFLRGYMVEDMTVEQFIECALLYNKENNITLDIKKAIECPVHVYAIQYSKPCMNVVSGISYCKLCGHHICPTIGCGRHNVNPVSRVTGYISSVSGWNSAKREELKLRHRYNIH